MQTRCIFSGLELSKRLLDIADHRAVDCDKAEYHHGKAQSIAGSFSGCDATVQLGMDCRIKSRDPQTLNKVAQGRSPFPACASTPSWPMKTRNR